MKKKILLLVSMVAMLFCVLAISIGAADYDKTRTAKLDDNTVLNLYDESGNALSYYMSNGVITAVKTADILSTGTTTINGTVYTTFNFKNVSASDMVLVNFQDDALGDLQVFNTNFKGSATLEYCYMPKTLERLSVNYDSANVFRETTKCKVVDFPVDCELNFIGKYSFYRATALKEIYIPANLEEFPETHNNGWDYGCFEGCTSLTKVTFAENSKLKSTRNATFKDCTNLSEITLPDGVESVGIYAFKNTAIVNSPFTVNSNCKYIDLWVFYGCTRLTNINIPKNATYNTTTNPQKQGLFQGCTSLTSVYFHEDTINTTYPSYMFTGCTALTQIKLPNTITKLSVRMFNNCSNLETIILGAKVQGMNELRSFSDHNSFTFGCDKLKYVYVPKTLKIDAETHSNACHMFAVGGNITFFYDGTLEEATALQSDMKNNVTSCGNNGKFTGATIISLEEYNKLETISKCYIVYGGNTCDMFYDGVHMEDGNTCMVDCDRCNTHGVVEKNPVHKGSVTIVYKTYDAQGSKIITCTNEGCNHEETIAVPALFTNQGYSAPINGNGGIAIGFLINNEAIAEYKAVTGNTIAYGVFAVAQVKLGNNTIFDENGNKANGVMSIDISTQSISAVDLKIVGFTDTQKDIMLALGGYVCVTENDKTTYSYMQYGTPAQGQNYRFDSYNTVLEILNTAQ